MAWIIATEVDSDGRIADRRRTIGTIWALIAEKGLDLNRSSIYIPSPA